MIDFKEFYKELGTLSSVLSREIIDKFCVALELDDDDKNLLSKRLNNTIPAVFRYIAKHEVREDNEDTKYSTAGHVRGILEKYLENKIKEADFKPAVIYRWLIQSLGYLFYTIGNCGTGLESAACSFSEVKDKDYAHPNDVRALINHFHRDIMPYVAEIEKLRDLCLVLEVLFKYCEKLF